jgi:hypothetical protein
VARRIQRKPKRYLSESTSKAPTLYKGTSFQEAVSILGGIKGTIIVILWLAGRFYMSGYFSAMNIPAFQINNGKYYLFRDIDPVTCKPEQVFIISDNSDIYLNVRPITPVEAPCVEIAVEAPVTKP